MKSEHMPGLDLLRAAAILLVLCAHLPCGQVGSVSGPLKFHSGVLGVDLFFALSGFLIGGILLDTGVQLSSPRILGGFWLNRWLRTLPNYYLLFAVNLALHLWVLPLHHVRWEQVFRTAVFCQNLTGRPSGFFGESWSLSIEEWFYLLLPLGLFLGLRTGFKFRTVAAVLLAAMLIEPIGRRFLLPMPESFADLNAPVLNKFDALGVGVAAAWLARTRPRQWRRLASVSLLAGLLLIGTCLAMSQWPAFLQYRALRTLFPLVEPLGCALLLPACAAWAGWKQPSFAAGTAAVARWSYSVYLINFTIGYQIVIVRIVPHLPTGAFGSIAGNVAFVTLCLAFAAGLYRLYERPFLRLRRHIAVCREANAARMRENGCEPVKRASLA